MKTTENFLILQIAPLIALVHDHHNRFYETISSTSNRLKNILLLVKYFLSE